MLRTWTFKFLISQKSNFNFLITLEWKIINYNFGVKKILDSCRISAKSHFGQCTTSASFTCVGSFFCHKITDYPKKRGKEKKKKKNLWSKHRTIFCFSKHSLFSLFACQLPVNIFLCHPAGTDDVQGWIAKATESASCLCAKHIQSAHR